MTRESVDSPSGKQDFNVSEFKSEFRKEYKSIYNKIANKAILSLVAFLKKTLLWLGIYLCATWFNIHNEQLTTGLTSLAMGDIEGIYLIFNIDTLESFKEANNLRKGVDPKWELYEKTTGKIISKDFVYLGDGTSLTKDLILIKKATNDCDIETCDDIVTYADLDEMNEICEDLYGASVPNWHLLDRLIVKGGPVRRSNINVWEDKMEWSSSVNPEDSDEYRLLFKDSKQEKVFLNKTNQGYLDKDYEKQENIGFRCYIQL